MARPTPRLARRALAPTVALAALATLACGRGDDGGPSRTGASAAENGGTLVIHQPDPDVLLPPLVAGVQGKMVTDLLFEHLAEIGDGLNTIGDGGFQPRLARRWTWAPDSMSVAFELDPRARWHDGRPVRASDVRFGHQLWTDPAVASPTAANLANIDSVSVRDSLTAVVHFKARRPEAFFEAVYNMLPLPEHALKDVPRDGLASAPFSRNPVGSGRWRLVRWEAGQRLELAADTAHFLGRPRLDRLVFSPLTDPAAAPTRLFAGEVDVLDQVRPNVVAEIPKHPSVKLVSYRGLAYAFMQFNLQNRRSSAPHPIFGNREARRALTMALDRATLVRSVFDSMAYVSIGPVTRGLAVADTTIPQLPFDTARAAAILDSLGWRDANGDGIREKGGRPLRFALLVPSTSKPRTDMAVLIQAQLRRAGVQVDIEPIDFNAFLQREASRDFDAVLGSWASDPSLGSIRQTWGGAGATPQGSNYGMYRSARFDAYVDSALATYDPAAARRHMRVAYETIIADAPAVWLYEGRPAMGLHARVRPAALRPDAWWAGLHEWHIPTAERLPRDRPAPATTAARP